MSEFKINREKETGDIVFSGRVSVADLQALKLDQVDAALLDTACADAHECLMVLECIFRRMREQIWA